MKLTQHFWDENKTIYEKILRLPFLKELMAGTLARKSFVFYLEQDALYLIECAKAFNQLAHRMHTIEHMKKMMEFAQGALMAERSIHEHYFLLFNIEPVKEMMPTCLAYSNFLRVQITHSTVEEALASLLPCFWIYAEVGVHILKHASLHNNPYRDWITTYGGEAFQSTVKEMIDMTELFAQQTTVYIQKCMKQAYSISCRYEWMFWDAAYRLETWLPD